MFPATPTGRPSRRGFHEGTATYLAADPHSGLSEGYQEFQNLFFYLVQRFGVVRLQAFYGGILGGDTVAEALSSVYGIPDAAALFARSARWHGLKDRVKTALWIGALAVVVAAFRRSDRPYIGFLLVLSAFAVGLAVATGLAEHIYGLRGPMTVLGAKIGFSVLAVGLGLLGSRRIVRHRSRQTESA